MADTSKELHWVMSAQNGDREALDALLKSIQAPIYRYIFSLVGERHLAENITQEAFISIYRKLRWLREPELFRAWAFRIASREAFKHLKRERVWSDQVREAEVLEAIPTSPREECTQELIDRLPQLLSRISPSSRAVIVLHYLNEMTIGEMAAVLEIPIGTVKSRLAYGLRSLRQQL